MPAPLVAAAAGVESAKAPATARAQTGFRTLFVFNSVAGAAADDPLAKDISVAFRAVVVVVAVAVVVALVTAVTVAVVVAVVVDVLVVAAAVVVVVAAVSRCDKPPDGRRPADESRINAE